MAEQPLSIEYVKIGGETCIRSIMPAEFFWSVIDAVYAMRDTFDKADEAVIKEHRLTKEFFDDFMYSMIPAVSEALDRGKAETAKRERDKGKPT